MLPGLGLVLAASVTGHPWTADPRSLAVGADAVHLAAAAIWVGGLVAMVAVIGLIGDRARLATRFSAVALGAVAVVAVAGSISAIIQVNSWSALVETGYGRLVLAKVAGLVVLASIGWLNRRQLLPVVTQVYAPLRRSMRVELAIAAVVLGLTAALIGQPPPRVTVSEPVDTEATVDGLTTQLVVDPARAGTNDLHLYFYEDSTLAPVDAVEVTVAIGEVPPRRVEITPVTPSHVSAYGASLSQPGTWTVSVTVVRGGQPTTTDFEVPIR